MTKWFLAAALLSAVTPAFADGVAKCTLGADKKTVTVTASNPYSQVMACEVNCHMDIPGGFATVVCVKPVPVGSGDFVMCTDVSKDGNYTRVKETEANCPDPTAKPAAAKDDPKADSGKDGDDDDDDDDAKADETMKKMQKQGQEMLNRLKQK